MWSIAYKPVSSSSVCAVQISGRKQQKQTLSNLSRRGISQNEFLPKLVVGNGQGPREMMQQKDTWDWSTGMDQVGYQPWTPRQLDTCSRHHFQCHGLCHGYFITSAYTCTLLSVLVFYRYHNKWPQTQLFKTTRIYHVAVLWIRNPE